MGWKDFKEKMKLEFEEGRKRGSELRRKKGEKDVQVNKNEPEK